MTSQIMIENDRLVLSIETWNGIVFRRVYDTILNKELEFQERIGNKWVDVLPRQDI